MTEGSRRDEVILQRIASILRTGQADGEFRAFDPGRVAWAIRTLLDGFSSNTGLNRRSTSMPASRS